MKHTSINYLLAEGILVKEEEDATLERDEFVSYVIADGYVVQTIADYDERLATVNYVQQYNDDVEGTEWILQLERLPEEPNHIPFAQTISRFNIFKVCP